MEKKREPAVSDDKGLKRTTNRHDQKGTDLPTALGRGVGRGIIIHIKHMWRFPSLKKRKKGVGR